MFIASLVVVGCQWLQTHSHCFSRGYYHMFCDVILDQIIIIINHNSLAWQGFWAPLNSNLQGITSCWDDQLTDAGARSHVMQWVNNQAAEFQLACESSAILYHWWPYIYKEEKAASDRTILYYGRPVNHIVQWQCTALSRTTTGKHTE